MSNLISDIVFVVAILVFLVALGRGLVKFLSYADTDWDQVTAWSFALFHIIGVVLFATASMYVVFVSNIHVLSAESVKLEVAIYFLIVAIATYFVSIRIEKAILGYCIKYELFDE